MGGAEHVQFELSKKLVKDGHQVIHLVPGFKNCQKNEEIDGVKIHRTGKSILFFYALPFVFFFKYAKKTDFLVDCFNCFGSFTSLFFKQSTFLINHIQGKIWFTETNPVFAFIGFLIEKIQLYIYGFLLKRKTITISESTKQEMLKFGFKKDLITVILMFINNQPEKEFIEKEKIPNRIDLIFIGRLVKMKRAGDAILLVQKLIQKGYQTKLRILGSGYQLPELKQMVKDLDLENQVELCGRVSEEEKNKYIKQAYIGVVTSLKEGWGLIVNEFNSHCIPCVSYDVAGLRDSNKYGLLSPLQDIDKLAENVIELYENKQKYTKFAKDGWQYSKTQTLENSYQEFKQLIINNE